MLKLYYANTSLFKNEGVFDIFLEKVNEQRRKKVLRCKNDKDKQCSLLAGMLLMFGLEQLGIDYEKLEFSVTAEGKPVIKNRPDILFSLSHSGNCAVCLISDQEIGVDMEWKGRRLLGNGQEKQLTAVAKKSFSVAAFEEYACAKEELKKEVFLKHWTRKEALGKAFGKGLAMDFSKKYVEEENFLSFWLEEEYYLSIYVGISAIRKELEICMMN